MNDADQGREGASVAARVVVPDAGGRLKKREGEKSENRDKWETAHS